MASLFKIKCKNHAIKQVHTIAGFMKNSEFTDCILVADGGILKAHRVILAASSLYFYNLFSSSSNDESQMFLVDNISYVDLYNIVRYIYVGELTIDNDYLSHFLDIGDMLEIKNIRDMEINIADNNCEIFSQNSVIKEEPVVILEKIEDASEIEDDNPQSAQEFHMKHLQVVHSSVANRMTKSTPSRVPRKKPEKKLVIKLPKSKRQNTVATVENSGSCVHCNKPYTVLSSLKRHQRFCASNPNRSMSICNICNEEVKPGSMTYHRKRYHNYVAGRRRYVIVPNPDYVKN